MKTDRYEVWTRFPASGRPDMLKYQGTKNQCEKYKKDYKFSDELKIVHEDDIIQDKDTNMLYFA